MAVGRRKATEGRMNQKRGGGGRKEHQARRCIKAGQYRHVAARVKDVKIGLQLSTEGYVCISSVSGLSAVGNGT